MDASDGQTMNWALFFIAYKLVEKKVQDHRPTVRKLVAAAELAICSRYATPGPHHLHG
jgi:hypothetical protein